MKTVLTFLSALPALFILLALSACQQQNDQPLPPLLEVGLRQLTLQQFEREMKINYPDTSGLPEQELLQLKGQLIRQLIDRELVLGEAARLNIQITPDELDAAMAEVRGNYSSEEFDKVLKQTGKTLEGWSAGLKLRLLTAKVSSAVLVSQVNVSEQAIEDYYKTHKEDFHRPVEISARQMLFKNREDAIKVLKLLKEGGDFITLAHEYSLSPDREDGGALGYFAKGQLPVEFDEVLFKLPVRQVSDPVESPYGVHLFLVEHRRRAGLRTFAAVKDEIADKLSLQKEETAFQAWLEQLQETTKTTVNWDLLTQNNK